MATLKVGADGKAPSNAVIGDVIDTGGGFYKITGGTPGNWQSEKVTDPGSWVGGSKADSGPPPVNIGTVDKPVYIDVSGPRPGYTNEGGKGGAGALPGNYAATGSISSNEQLYQDYLKNMQAEYERIAREQAEAQRAAIAAGVGQLENSRLGINAGYEDLARQLYIDRRQAERKIPQQLAAQGYTGGLAESSNLNLQTAYQELLSQGERARLGEMGNLDAAIANLQSSGDLAIAQQGGQISQNAMNAYLQVLDALAADRRWAADLSVSQQQFAQQMGLSQQQLAAQQAQYQQQFGYAQSTDDYNKQLKIAQLLAEYGDFSGYANMGYDTTLMQQYYARLLAQQAASGGSGGSKSAAAAAAVPSGFTDSGAKPASPVNSAVYAPATNQTLANLAKTSKDFIAFRNAARIMGYSDGEISQYSYVFF
jgi:hypothetical protein